MALKERFLKENMRDSWQIQSASVALHCIMRNSESVTGPFSQWFGSRFIFSTGISVKQTSQLRNKSWHYNFELKQKLMFDKWKTVHWDCDVIKWSTALQYINIEYFSSIKTLFYVQCKNSQTAGCWAFVIGWSRFRIMRSVALHTELANFPYIYLKLHWLLWKIWIICWNY